MVLTGGAHWRPGGTGVQQGRSWGCEGGVSFLPESSVQSLLFLLSLEEAFPQTPHPGISRSPRHLICPVNPAWDAPESPSRGTGGSHRLPGAESFPTTRWGMDTLPRAPRSSAPAAFVPRSLLEAFHGLLLPCSSRISPTSVRPCPSGPFFLWFCAQPLCPPRRSQHLGLPSPGPEPPGSRLTPPE